MNKRRNTAVSILLGGVRQAVLVRTLSGLL